MKKGVIIGIIIIIILAVIIAAALYFVIYPSQVNKNNANINNNQITGNNENPLLIEIKNFVFSPSILTIKNGDKVTFTNMDGTSHTITENNGLFDSGILKNGQSYTFTSSKLGTFEYHCTLHPYMKGKIIVE